eukprot:g61917.t1
MVRSLNVPTSSCHMLASCQQTEATDACYRFFSGWECKLRRPLKEGEMAPCAFSHADEIAQAMQAILKRDEQKKRRKQGGGGRRGGKGGGRGGGRGRWITTPPVEAAMPKVEDGVEEKAAGGLSPVPALAPATIQQANKPMRPREGEQTA